MTLFSVRLFWSFYLVIDITHHMCVATRIWSCRVGIGRSSVMSLVGWKRPRSNMRVEPPRKGACMWRWWSRWEWSLGNSSRGRKSSPWWTRVKTSWRRDICWLDKKIGNHFLVVVAAAAVGVVVGAVIVVVDPEAINANNTLEGSCIGRKQNNNKVIKLIKFYTMRWDEIM